MRRLQFSAGWKWALVAAAFGLPVSVSRAEEYTVTVEATVGEPSPELPAQLGEVTRLPLTATVKDPPSDRQTYYSYSTLNGPYWKRPPAGNAWELTFEYSNGDLTSFSTASPTSFCVAVMQESESNPEAEVEFIPLAEGHFRMTARALVSYNTGAGGDTWTGVGTAVAKLIPAAAALNLPFKMESNPNSTLAVGPTWKAQINPYEVLKGWKTRYTAPDPAVPGRRWVKVEWYDGTGNKFGEGNPLVYTESSTGNHRAKYKATDDLGMEMESTSRPQTVTEVVVPVVLLCGMQQRPGEPAA